MKIELKNLKVANHLSQETTAYSASVYVNGKRAFHAQNAGQGGADDFHRVQGYDGPALAEIDAWLADHEPPAGPMDPDPATRAAYDTGMRCDLELLVSRLITEKDAARMLGQLLNKKILALGADNQVHQYKAAPTPANIAALIKRNPEDTIINGAADDVLAKARRALCGAEDTAEAVYVRQRENRLTQADAHWLLAQDRAAKKPCSELQAELLAFIAAEDARLAEHRRAMSAQREEAASKQVG